ncbi:spike base protein, RCAP_Rcc01079 family [Pseudoroseicyclus aestuarii]|uniref:DUF2917 family protein n=1 Tax=Pseudoroseicyclus aestuarii TaxID=1795041 RepID=A0A318SPG8_9RHOB|nr:hypothetical protein [Pseudoroseicyclus aestuarii]PYE82228.1 hypothetical protein DFP88_10568 [Pseudoroseicyclus aestuarii]
MPQDPFRNHATSLHGPASSLEIVVPDDDTDLPRIPRALCVGESGWVSVVTASGETGDVFIAAGVPFPLRVRRVRASGTTATGLRGLL